MEPHTTVAQITKMTGRSVHAGPRSHKHATKHESVRTVRPCYSRTAVTSSNLKTKCGGPRFATPNVHGTVARTALRNRAGDGEKYKQTMY